MTGELVGKPPIAHKFHRINYKFLNFATFGGIRVLFSVQQAYVHNLSSMNHTYVRRQ
jgi:hypothetical protein